MLLYLKICQKKNLTQYFVLSVDTENLYEVANEATIFIVVIIGKIISKNPNTVGRNGAAA